MAHRSFFSKCLNDNKIPEHLAPDPNNAETAALCDGRAPDVCRSTTGCALLNGVCFNTVTNSYCNQFNDGEVAVTDACNSDTAHICRLFSLPTTLNQLATCAFSTVVT